MDFAVIMAGGTGKRLWPLSRQTRPKQVLELLDGDTLLRKCFDRLQGIFDLRNIIVLTNAGYVDLVRENLSELPPQNVIAEPAVRDTASAIGLAASVLHKFDPDANMAVVTADQILEPKETFQQAMQSALTFVNNNPEALVTFGIQPTFPSTQLGYVKFGDAAPCEGAVDTVYAIDAFKEKPDEATAKSYLDSGQYAWNSGLFVWKCATILKNLKTFLPECAEPLEAIETEWGKPDQQRVLQEWFPKLPKISIDFAVMEKSDSVYGINLPCRWLDLGSFAALVDILESDPDNNIVVSGFSELLVENMIVAHSKDATLVCPIDQAHRLKELLEKVKDNHPESFL
jgi:mannose-1-phosphate guanylyltransferase